LPRFARNDKTRVFAGRIIVFARDEAISLFESSSLFVHHKIYRQIAALRSQRRSARLRGPNNRLREERSDVAICPSILLLVVKKADCRTSLVKTNPSSSRGAQRHGDLPLNLSPSGQKGRLPHFARNDEARVTARNEAVSLLFNT